MTRFSSTPEQKKENRHLNKYYISSSGDRTWVRWDESRLQAHPCAHSRVPRRHDGLIITYNFSYYLKTYRLMQINVYKPRSTKSYQ